MKRLLPLIFFACGYARAVELCPSGEYVAAQEGDRVRLMAAVTLVGAAAKVSLQQRADNITPPAFDLVCEGVQPGLADTPYAATAFIDGQHTGRDVFIFTAKGTERVRVGGTAPAPPPLSLAKPLPSPAPELADEIGKLRETYTAYVKAQTAPDEELKFTYVPRLWRQPDSNCRMAWSSLGTLLAQFDTIDKEYQGISGKAGIGFSNDRTGAQNRSKADIATQFRAGTYPSEVRVRAAALLDFQSDRTPEAITEDVTEILLNYDHFFTPMFETFAFLERFTDTFMSIDQCYEAGIGAKLEWNWGPLTSKGAKHRRDLDNAIARFEAITAAPPDCLINASEKPLTLPARLSNLADDDAFHQAIIKSKSRYQMGISLAALADFEQADSTRFQTIVPGADPVDRSLKSPGTQRYRLSARPSWRVNFGDAVSWEGRFFYKPALDSPRRIDGQRDYRMEAKSELKWALAQAGARANKNVSLSLSYDWRYDAVPPSIDDFVGGIIAPLATQAGIDPSAIVVKGRLTGERRHSLLRLRVDVDL